jgi:hypothetical protein
VTAYELKAPVKHVTLDDLALKYGTDKGSHHHGYTSTYPLYFDELQGKPIALVELGVFEGASLRMWQKYFWNRDSHIYGIDQNVSLVRHRDSMPRNVKLYEGDQAKPPPTFCTASADIIIDDASHFSSKTIESFRAWWPYLKPGGIYVVEDVHACYQVDFYGTAESNSDPDQPPVNGKQTAMQFLRRLTDELNWLTMGVPRYPLWHRLGYDLEWIHFYPDIVFLKKAGTAVSDGLRKEGSCQK